MSDESLRAAASAAGGCGSVLECDDPTHEWYHYGELAERLSGGLRTHEAAEFVAACKPSTVLDLLERLGRAEGAVAKVRQVCVEWGGEPNLPPAVHNAIDDVLTALNVGETS